MRRMKPVPTELYPITNFEEAEPDINLVIEGDILNKLKKSPHSITFYLYSELAGYADHAGVVEIKMLPGQIILNGDDTYSYSSATLTDNIGELFIAYGYLAAKSDYPALYLFLSMLSTSSEAISYNNKFKTVLNKFIEQGYGLGDIAKISIEPVSDSNLIKSLIV